MTEKIPPLSSKQLEPLLVSIDEIQPHPDNYKIHTPEQIASLRASLKAFGWTTPIKANLKEIIVAGHGMYELAKQDGYTHVPVEYCALDDNLSKAYLVADNETARKAVTDENKLAKILESSIEIPDFDITATGFDFGDLDSVLNYSHEPISEEAERIAEEEAEESVKKYINIEKNSVKVFHALAGEGLGLLNHYNYLFSYTQNETKIKQPFPEDSILFLDSGALSGVEKYGPDYLSVENQERILRRAEELGAHWVTMLDVPFVDQVLTPLGKTLEEAYRIHLRNAKAFKELKTDLRKVYVIQGQTFAEYRRCCNDMKDFIEDGDVVAIGTIKAKSKDSDMIEKVTALVHSYYPNNDIHLFGITRAETIARAIRVGATSCDSASVSMFMRTGRVTVLDQTETGAYTVKGILFSDYSLSEIPISISTQYHCGMTAMGMMNVNLSIALEIQRQKALHESN